MRSLIILEGAELSGKSSVASQLYPILEAQNHSERYILNGCHWFNSDIGIFGTKYGRLCIEHYLAMAESIPDHSIIFEKFHITDQVYTHIYRNEKIEYTDIEKRLQQLDARIIFCRVDENESLIAARLADRLRLYPHYAGIAQEPAAYIGQQREYESFLKLSTLPILTLDTTRLPNPDLTTTAITWLQNAKIH